MCLSCFADPGVDDVSKKVCDGEFRPVQFLLPGEVGLGDFDGGRGVLKLCSNGHGLYVLSLVGWSVFDDLVCGDVALRGFGFFCIINAEWKVFVKDGGSVPVCYGGC